MTTYRSQIRGYLSATVLALLTCASGSYAAGDPVNGKLLYNDETRGNGNACSSCHLADPTRNQSSVLNGSGKAAVIQAAIGNDTGGMGEFAGNLSLSELDDIAAYLSAVPSTATSALNFGAVLNGADARTITLTNAGSGYTSAPTITLSAPPSGTTATAIASYITFATGTVSIVVTNGGTGYTNAANTVVTISGVGSSAAGQAIISGGQVTQVIMTNPGTGYDANTTVTISGGGATNAATAIAVVNTNPIVDVAVFSGRVWVAQGRTVTYSAAGSYSDFTSVSAGSFTLTDSTLHGNIRALMSANNFLYIFGDDSINVFSDLRVTSTGSTIFTNTNVSASIGTRRQKAIFPYFRSVLFMNDYGVYALVGSTTSKISDQLDGIFPYIDFTLPVTAGQVLLNNILCAAFNFTYSPPSTTPRQLQAVFFDKKWFLTSQGSVDYITSVPVSGFIDLYGVDGKDFYKLYSSTTAAVNTEIQTALSPMQDSIRTKQALKFGVEAILTQGATFYVTVDSEQGSSPLYTLNNYAQWLNNASQVIPWVNGSSQTINWIITQGYFLYKSDAQQYGKYLGLTLTSSDPNFVVSTFEFEHELRVRF